MTAPAWAEDYLLYRQLDEVHWLVMMPLYGGRGRIAVANKYGVDGDFV